MPRKYHRPPSTTKRRKTRRSAIPYEFEAPPAETAVVEEELSEDGDQPEPSLNPPARVSTTDGQPARAERHVNVDYSYVRGDVIRIAAIISFLVIALVITSILR